MGGPRFYRRRATVEAMEWTGDAECVPDIVGWLKAHTVALVGQTIIINEATRADPGNWIVLSPNNRLHICQAKTFGEVHELALVDPPYSSEANMAAHLAAARAASNYWKAIAQMLAGKAGVELPKPPALPVTGD